MTDPASIPDYVMDAYHQAALRAYAQGSTDRAAMAAALDALMDDEPVWVEKDQDAMPDRDPEWVRPGDVLAAVLERETGVE